MSRPANHPEPDAHGGIVPSEDHARLALQEMARLMQPLVVWLLRSGVPYPVFAEMMKSVFVDTARAELERAAVRPTHSALSVLSGVHRKDVRSLESTPRTTDETAARGVPLASQVFTRWVTHPRYRSANGKPRRLPRNGAEPSFESLARELSSDVHPRTLLDELIRLGLATLDGDEVVLSRQSFVPSRRLEALTALFAANGADHLGAAVHNLTRDGPKFLEQSVYADGLTEASVAHLHEAARDAWAVAFKTMVAQAQARVDTDATADATGRMRFGVYYYSEPGPGAAAPVEPAEERIVSPRTRVRAPQPARKRKPR